MVFSHSTRNAKFKTRSSPWGTLLKWESEQSYEHGETDHSASDSLFDDKSSLQSEAPSPPPLSNPALSSSGWVDQRETTGGSGKPESKKKKEKLGEEEIPVLKRNGTQSRLHRKPRSTLADTVLLQHLAPDKPDIASRIGDSSPLLTLDNPTFPKVTSIGEILRSIYTSAPGNFGLGEQTGTSLDALDVRRRERYSAERMTTSSISIKSTISEDLSREDKDRGAKLRYLQKRHERQTLGSYKV